MLRQVKINLHAIVGDVRKNAGHIRVATHEIAAGNMELSGRTESQASSLEETAASMEEFASTVSQNTDNANIASTMAQDALRIADQGGKLTNQMVSTMDDIGTASREQRAGILQVNEAVTLMDTVTQQNAALVEEAAAAAASLSEQTITLVNALSVFKLEHNSIKSRPSQTTRRRPLN